MKTVLIYGATGTTGMLVARELIARGVRPLLGGRSEARLRAAAGELGIAADSVVVADATHPPDVARMVERAGVVVACAGPFIELGEPTVAACAADQQRVREVRAAKRAQRGAGAVQNPVAHEEHAVDVEPRAGAEP